MKKTTENISHLLAKPLIWLVRFYRKYLSGLMRNPPCKFIPVCSVYAEQALLRFGFFKGLCLTLYRLLRCNPFSKGGFDPVPEKKERKDRS